MKRPLIALLSVATASAMTLSACGSSSKNSSSTTAGSSNSTAGGGHLTASDTGVTPTTIKIGYITSETGSAASSFSDALGGAEAAFDAANAAGGVDGRQVQLVSLDDTSTPAGFATAANAMLTKNVFGVIPYSSFTFGGYKPFQQAGVPVVGNSFDGPEWGQQPNSNMFSIFPPISTTWGGKYYYPNSAGQFLKGLGKTKLAGLAYGISPSSQASIKAVLVNAPNLGQTNCYGNYSVPFGGVDFTADVLSIKKAGCDAVMGSFVDASDQAMSTAIDQAGLTNVAKIWFTGYDQNTLSTAATKAAFEGSYFLTQVVFDRSIPGMGAMLDNLAKYDKSFKVGSIPDYGTWGSYIAAQLMIYGLQKAGPNPTRKAFINDLRSVNNWTDDGMLPGPTSFTNFGTPQMIPKSNCEYFMELKNGAFVNADPGGKPICVAPVVFSS